MLSERFAWSENVDRWCASVAVHDRYFTYAENIHGPDCLVPTLGLPWRTTRMPVVDDLWAKAVRTPPPPFAPWTTVMTWNAFKGKLLYGGVEYTSKGPEFEKLMPLPRQLNVPLRVAVGGVGAPLDRLASWGWEVQDGPGATVTPEDYQAFIVASRGELSPAKHVYVAMRTGWFSCRSACYLAAARPVVVQDTGFGVALPAGEGILAFSTTEQAVAALQEAESRYARHAQAARAIAREYFDSAKVLARLIEDALGGA
jgi:hypothetical protein